MALVDWTGRARRADKRGAIDAQLPVIIQRLNLDPQAWQLSMRSHGNVFGRALGQLDHMRLHAKTLGQSWVHFDFSVMDCIHRTQGRRRSGRRESVNSPGIS